MLKDDHVLLDVVGLRKFFPIRKGFLQRVEGYVRAVDDVSFHISEGETFSLVGESGCGKTTTARCILRALSPTSGQIFFRTQDDRTVDLASLPEGALQPLRREMQLVFQDPFTSLNPRMNVFGIVSEPLLVHGLKDRRQLTERVAELLQMVGLRPEYMQRYPHAFSGGERQRIGIARALALHPRLIVLDEPVSALDVSVQAQVLNLLLELQERLHLTYLLVAHNLSVIRHVSDRVAVMYVGRIVETASSQDLFEAPQHPYTAALMASIPVPNPFLRRPLAELQGEVANPAHPPEGCYFHPRCAYALPHCKAAMPELREVAPGHQVRCHRAGELSLQGTGGLATGPTNMPS